MTGSVLGSLCSITDFGAEKLKVLVELNLLGPTFDSFTLGCASEGGGGVGTLFSFFRRFTIPCALHFIDLSFQRTFIVVVAFQNLGRNRT